jgi:N-acetylneuraminic acid mutarotase
MLVLGPTAGAYNPATSTWRPVSREGPGATEGAVTGWTGHQVLVWGGVCCAPSNGGNAYHVRTNTWTVMPAAPLAPRAFPAGAWTGRELVVAGGYVRAVGTGAVKTFRNGAAYNPATGTWRRLPLMPRPRSNAQAVWDGKEVLFLGGFRAPRTAPATRGMAYNPATNTWTRLKDMPFPGISHTGTESDGNFIYLAGGYPGRVNASQTFSTTNVWRYDTTNDSWTLIQPLPAARGAGTLCRLNRTLYFMGGADSNRADRAETCSLNLDDPSAKWVQRASMPAARNHLGSAALGGFVYVLGGGSGQDNSTIFRSDVFRYDPSTNTWSAAGNLGTARSGYTTTLLPNGKVLAAGEKSTCASSGTPSPTAPPSSTRATSRTGSFSTRMR